MRFSRESRMCYPLSFSTIKTWGQWLRFQGKVEKPNFWQHFCNYWMNQIFPGNSGFVSLYPITSFNFMPSFGKILWSVIEKSSGLTNERTNGRTDEHGSIYRTNLQSRWVQKHGVNDLYFPLESKNLIFDNIFAIIEGTRFFPENPASSVCAYHYPAISFMLSFEKILCSVIRKSSGTDGHFQFALLEILLPLSYSPSVRTQQSITLSLLPQIT